MSGLVVVDPVSSGVDYVPNALARGMDVLVILTPGLPPAFASQAAALRASYPGVEFLDFPPGTPDRDFDSRFVPGDWDYVVGAGETGTAAADHVRRLLDVTPRNAEPDEPRLDKFSAQQALERAGLRHIRSWCVSDRAGVDEIRGWSFPLVVKPTASAGTDGVQVVDSADQLVAAVEKSLGIVNALGRYNERLVVQEYVQGVEYVVDGCVYGQSWRAADVCRYEKDLVNGVPVYRSLTWLNRDAIPDVNRLEAYVSAILPALGVHVGCFHAEFFRTVDDWVMIEIGLRPHGGGHPRFTEMVTGTSQIELELDCVAAGGLASGALPPLLCRGVVVFFSVDHPVVFHADPGEALAHIEGLAHSSINVRSGEAADPPRTLFDTFGLGFVVLLAETEQQLAARAEVARAVFAGCHN